MERKVVIGIMLTMLFIGILTLAFNCQLVKADGTVSGKVTESDGVTPIVGALVEALQQGDLVVSSATTGTNGNYSLSLTEGTYKVRASEVDYITAIKTVVNVITGNTIVDFNLTRGQMVVFDEFTGTSLNTNKWNYSYGASGAIYIYNATGSSPTNLSAVCCSNNFGSGGAAIFSANKLNTSVPSCTVIFEGRINPYVEGSIGQYVYGDRQPRGLRAGTDENNAIEFRSASSSIEARTVASGNVTTTNYYVGQLISNWNWIYRIEANSTCAKFYVNDVLIATHTTNIPTGQLNIYVGTSYVGGGNIPVSVDYVYMAVLQPPTPVGGVWIPVDKFALLAPYIALVSTILIATAATTIYVKRRKKKQ